MFETLAFSGLSTRFPSFLASGGSQRCVVSAESPEQWVVRGSNSANRQGTRPEGHSMVTENLCLTHWRDQGERDREKNSIPVGNSI